MRKAIWMICGIIVLVMICTFAVACKNTGTPTQKNEEPLNFGMVYAFAEDAGYTGTMEELVALFKGDNAYQLAVAAGYKGTQEEWIASLKGAAGKDGLTPSIGENKHWYIGGVDTGVLAEGKDGVDGKDGSQGIQGEKGEVGATGNGINRIEKTGSEGRIDTYTIYFTDGTTTTFEITNGANGTYITRSAINNNQELILTLSDGTVLNAGKLDGSHVHAFSDWSVVTPSTCTEAGMEERTCACGEKETRVSSLAAHTWGDWSILQDSTCSAMGEKTHMCLACNAEETQSIPLAAHSYGEWIIFNAATCTTAGLRYHTCSLCENVEKETIAATGHTGEWNITRDATCIALGRKELNCSTCGFSVVESIAATGHDLGAWEKKTKSTCGVGIETRKCTKCSYYENNPVAPETNQHSFVAGICSVCGEHQETEGLSFSISGNAAYVSDYTGTDDIVYVPATHAGLLVTGIGSNAFYNKVITEIHLPDSITYLGYGAFEECRSLVTVELGKCVKNINSNAFRRCRAMNRIVLPEVLSSIGSSAFSECESLTELIIPDYVTTIGDGAFGYTGISTIKIPDGVKSSVSFRFCDAENVTLSKSITTINSGAFGYSGVKYLVVPDLVTSIGNQAFYCSGIQTIVIPKSVKSIGSEAFVQVHIRIYYEGTELEWNAIQKGLNWAMDGYDIYFYASNHPEKQTNCWHYEGKKIVIGAEQGPHSYSSEVPCITRLCEICGYVCRPTIAHNYIDGFCKECGIYETGSLNLQYQFDESSDSYIVAGIGTCTDTVLYIPTIYNEKPVTAIAAGAFYGNSSIQGVYLNEPLKVIGDQAFCECSNLKTVVLNTTLTIMDDVFGYTWDADDFCIYVRDEYLSSYEAISDSGWQRYCVQRNRLKALSQMQ